LRKELEIKGINNKTKIKEKSYIKRKIEKVVGEENRHSNRKEQKAKEEYKNKNLLIPISSVKF